MAILKSIKPQTFLFLALAIGGLHVKAESQVDTNTVTQSTVGTAETVRYYNVANCSSWNFISTSYGSGYLCSSYPGTISVPEVRTTVNAINEVEKTLLARIEALEARIKELEKK